MNEPLFREPAPRVTGYREVTLARVAGELARTLGGIGPVLVTGEVANRKSSFLTLRDHGLELAVYVPASRASRCRAANGERVSIAGNLQMARGRVQVQLVAEQIIPVGEGAIAARIEQVRAQLRAEGLLDRPRRRVPMLPLGVAVICGTDAAVRRDIESVAAHRFDGYPIEFLEVTVQGPNAVDAIVWALGVCAARGDVDVIILARGGGDASALLPFSDEAVCRAIASCPKPVVSAIGHDGDRPLSDDVADLRAGTPSIAASMVIPSREALVARIDGDLTRCERAVDGVQQRSAQHVARLRWSDALDRRLERVDSLLAQLHLEDRIDRRLAAAQVQVGSLDWRRPLATRLQRDGAALAATGLRIEALSPRRVLERGYAIVRQGGAVVRDASAVQRGAVVDVEVARGAFQADVVSVDGEATRSGAAGVAPR